MVLGERRQHRRHGDPFCCRLLQDVPRIPERRAAEDEGFSVACSRLQFWPTSQPERRAKRQAYAGKWPRRIRKETLGLSRVPLTTARRESVTMAAMVRHLL